MLLFLIPIILLASEATCSPLKAAKYSAASAAQIRSAIDNKYDDTGPGAKEPAHAYKTYNNLDDALVAYYNDPDTKLPIHEKAKAIANLYKNNRPVYGETLPPRVDTFTGNKQKVVPIVLSRYNKFGMDPRPYIMKDYKGYHVIHDDLKGKELFKWQKEQSIKPSPLDVSRFNKDNNYLDLSKSKHEGPLYDVTNKYPAELKSSQEIRDGSGAVHGYYTVVQADGKRRTVHYQADPLRGFRSSVQHVFKN